MLPYGVFALMYGPLSRLFDNKHIASVSLFLFSVFSFLSGCAATYQQLFIFRFLVGIFAAATTPLVLIHLADHVGPGERGKYVGLFFSITFIADLSGIFLSGLIPWRAMFFIPSVLGLATAALTLKYFSSHHREKGLVSSRYLEALKRPEIFRAFSYIFVISLLYHGVRQWLGVYFVQAFGLKQLLVSITLTISSLAGIFGEAFGGHLSDRVGRVAVLKSGVFMMVVSLALLILARAYIFLPVAMLLWGLGWTMNHAGLSAYLTDMDKRFIREISSLNSSVRFIAGGLGVFLGGFILQKSFLLGFVIYGLCFLVLFLSSQKILLRTE